MQRYLLEKRLEKTNAVVISQYIDTKIASPIYISSTMTTNFFFVFLELAFGTALGRLSSGYTPSNPLPVENVALLAVHCYGGWLVHKLPEANVATTDQLACAREAEMYTQQAKMHSTPSTNDYLYMKTTELWKLLTYEFNLCHE